MIKKSCGFNFIQNCKYFNSGIDKLFIGDTSNVNFIYNNNIIVDMFPMTWFNIKFSNAKISSNFINGLEETVLDFEVPYIDLINKNELKKIKEKKYSFLILTKNNELYLLDSATNTQFIQQYTGNGFIIREISTKDKSIYQVDYNYYLYITNNLPIQPQPPIDDCSQYYDDLALSSTQPNALSVTCLIEDYDGWN